MIRKYVLDVDFEGWWKLYGIKTILALVIGLGIFGITHLINTINQLEAKVKIEKTKEIGFKEQISTDETRIKKLESTITDAKKGSLIQFTDKDLMADIITMYPHISLKVKKEIITTILEESAKFNINPLIIYALIHTESSMRFQIEHKQTLITIGDKKIRVKAVGLGGVVWEWWGDKLKAAGIAEVRSDLFDPITNVKATVFVYNELYKLAKHPKATTQDESALIRYFGGGYKSYFLKIDNKIAHIIRSRIYRTEDAK